MLLVLGFAVVGTLLRLTTAETKLARLEQSYSAALEAAKGGADIFIWMAQNQKTDLATYSGGGTPFGVSLNPGCLGTKMINPTSSTVWTAGGCTANASAPDPTLSPDVTVTLSNYSVSIKLIDTCLTDVNATDP